MPRAASSSALAAMVSALLFFASAAPAQTGGVSLYYREVERADAVYVFNSVERYEAFLATGKTGDVITLTRKATGGRNLIAQNETVLDLYLFKHDLPPWDRPAKAPPAPSFEVTWKDGKTTLKTKVAEIGISNRLQPRFTSEDLDPASSTAGPERSSFRIRRFKTKLEGWVYRKALEVELQVNWVDTTNLLDDANVNFDVTGGSRALMLKAGQFKVPFGRQQLTSAMSQQFLDRSFVADTFARGRDIGVQLWGTPWKSRVDWRVGLFNGNGRTVTRNDNDDLQFDARLTLQPFGDVKYSEGDFESNGKFLLAVAGQYERNTRQVAAAGGTPAQQSVQSIWGGDVVVKFLGVSLSGEYFERENEPTISSAYTDRGFTAQLGIFIVPKRLEVAARYSSYDPNAARAGDDRIESGIAAGWFFNKHVNKFQADFRRIEDELRGSEDRELRLQYVLFF